MKILATILAFLQFLPFATPGRGQENAYLAVLEEIIGDADDIKHISCDIRNPESPEAIAQLKALQKFCETHGKTLHLASLAELNERGLLEEGENGYAIGGERLAEIRFGSDIKQTKNSLTGGAGWFCGDCWGAWYDYTVKRIGCTWYIVDKINGPVA